MVQLQGSGLESRLLIGMSVWVSAFEEEARIGYSSRSVSQTFGSYFCYCLRADEFCSKISSFLMEFLQSMIAAAVVELIGLRIWKVNSFSERQTNKVLSREIALTLHYRSQWNGG